MGAIARLGRRLLYLLNRRRMDAELREEMAAHREAMEDPARFGNDLRLRETARALWGWSWLDALIGDLRLSARGLRRDLRFTVTAVGVLAIGLGVAALALALRRTYAPEALPYPDAARLHHVSYAPPGPWEPSHIARIDWPTLDDVVEHAITAAPARLYVPDEGGRPPLPVRALRVSEGFVRGLGLRAAAGRTFDAADLAPGGEPVAMIGHSHWMGRFGGDPSIVGRSLSLSDESGERTEFVRVIGVLPRRFFFGRDSRDSVDVLLPLHQAAQTYLVRLWPGVAPTIAAQRITQATRGVTTDLPADWTGVRLEAMPDRQFAALRPMLRMIAIAAAGALTIVCLNLAVLVLLRSLRRRKDIAVRAVLGASRLRLIRLGAADAVLLAAAGGVGALSLAHVLLRTAGPALAIQLGRPSPRGLDGVGVDGTVAATIGALALLVAVVLAVIPRIAAARDLSAELRGSGRGASAGPVMRRARGALVALEIGGSLALLVGCGLTVRSAMNLAERPRGFSPHAVLTARLAFPGTAYPTPEALLGLYDVWRDRTEEATSIRPAFANWPPFAEPPLHEVTGDDGTAIAAGAVAISDGYVATMGMALQRGRDFTSMDRVGGAPVALVSASLARTLWRDTDPIGRTLRAAAPSPRGTPDVRQYTVVGVVDDVRRSFDDADLREYYTSWLQHPPDRFATLYVRTAGHPATWARTLDGLTATLDPRIRVGLARAVRDDDQEARETRFLVTLFGGLALFAVLIAVMGLMGVTAYAVQQREREIAIRMALGAEARLIVRHILRGAAWLIVAGLAVGLLAALAVGRVLASRVYGLSASDPVTIVAACGLLGTAALAAAWLPARQAATEQNFSRLRDAD